MAAPVNYLKYAEFEKRLADLKQTYANDNFFKLIPLDVDPYRKTAEDERVMYCLRISGGAGSDRPAVLMTAGTHARELSPPLCLLKFVEGLLRHYKAGTVWAVDRAEVDYNGSGVIYDEFKIPRDVIRKVVNTLDLYVVPVVNPDGREYCLGADKTKMSVVEYDKRRGWRKNRRKVGNEYGVDINRNFPVAWDFEKYYSATAAGQLAHYKNASSENYRGEENAKPGGLPALEAETSNLVRLIQEKQVRFLLDLHTFGRLILHPWGIEQNQSLDADQNFQNPEWDRTGKYKGRDGVPKAGPESPTYREFISRRSLHFHNVIAKSMCHAIYFEAGGRSHFGRVRSRYKVEQACSLYMATGGLDDYVFSLQFLKKDPYTSTPLNFPRTYAFTMECGSGLGTVQKVADDAVWVDWGDGEGGFITDDESYQKVEREAFVGIYKFLSFVANWHHIL